MGIPGITGAYRFYGTGLYSRIGSIREKEKAEPFSDGRKQPGDRLVLSPAAEQAGVEKDAAELVQSEEDRLLGEELAQAVREAEAESKEKTNTANPEEIEEEPPKSERQGGAVAFNAAKRARQLAAASSRAQVQTVLSLLNQDLADCKYGLENGLCDQAEVDKVKAMLQRAQQRMSEVSQNEEQEQTGGFDAFAIASLM